MKQLFNMNFFSWVIKGIVGIAALLLSAILSYTFFLAISPAGMAVFPFAALSLTEGGFLGWILIFSLMKHHKITSVIALLMIGASFITTITVTFAELIQLFQDHSLVSNDTVKNGTLILLEVMLALHILAVASDFLVIKIEWLIKEYLSQNVTVVEAVQHSPTTITQSPVQHSLSQSSQVMSSDEDRYEWLARQMLITERQQQEHQARLEAARVRILAEQQHQTMQSQHPLAQPPLDTTASQPGTNGNTNGHQKSQA